MQNQWINEDDVKQVLFASSIDGEFDLDELSQFADKLVMFASFLIARTEREMCIEFVESLNTEVAKALQEKRGHL
jgi:hypothetical protein